jgi:hypothetical protein
MLGLARDTAGKIFVELCLSRGIVRRSRAGARSGKYQRDCNCY